MRYDVTLRHRTVISFPFALLSCALGWACSSPTSPVSSAASARPGSPPPPSPTVVRYRVSGVVTDDTGAPIAGVPLELDYPRGGNFASPPARCIPQAGCFISTSTNDRGEYAVSFEPGLGWVFNADGAGLIYSLRDGFEHDIQLLPRGAPDIQQPLRLRRVRTVSAGQPITVSIERDSALCSDLEDWWLLTNRCEVVTVLTGEAGTLTVEASAAQAAGDVAHVFFATSGRYTTTQRD
jgi:hypothetical protein